MCPNSTFWMADLRINGQNYPILEETPFGKCRSGTILQTPVSCKSLNFYGIWEKCKKILWRSTPDRITRNVRWFREYGYIHSSSKIPASSFNLWGNQPFHQRVHRVSHLLGSPCGYCRHVLLPVQGNRPVMDYHSSGSGYLIDLPWEWWYYQYPSLKDLISWEKAILIKL